MKSNLIAYLLLTGVTIALLHGMAMATFAAYSDVFTAIAAKLIELTQ